PTRQLGGGGNGSGEREREAARRPKEEGAAGAAGTPPARIPHGGGRPGDNWGPPVQGKDGRALLEFFWRAVYRALALRKENQHFAMAQAERAGLHGAQQVGVRVHRDQVNLPREPAHEWRDEVLARADEEDVAEETEGQRTHYENGVNVTLVVGAEQECALPREVLPSGNAETEKYTCQKVAELHGDKRSGGEDQTRFQERSKFGIVFIHPAEQHPPGIGVPRGQSRW